MPATFHTYIKLIDIILQTEYNKESPWYYKVSKEKEFYPIYQLQEDGSIISWAIDVGLKNLYFPDYNGNPNRLYTYIPHSQYNFFGVYDLTIAAEPEKRYIDYYKADYEYYLKEADADEKYWNKMIKEAPDTLNFWFDFLEEGELDQFSI
jgi:hypothetical protein